MNLKSKAMIELAKANPDIETLKLTLWIAGSIIIILMGIVAYFLGKQINVSELLTKAVNNLTTAVKILESQNSERHPVIVRRLNDHARRLDSHDRDIVCIKTKLNMNTDEK